ncbi:MAG: DUF294 nucleotidyltransferase-like domain-containing protein, partial [Blastocatellia bacterium]
MQIDLETIQHHVGEKLRRIETHEDEAERLAALKKFLRIETQRLHLRHRFGIGGTPITRARSLMVDVLIRQLARDAAAKCGGDTAENGAGFSIIALGGYGREELSPHSDIDVLFLFGKKDAAYAAAMSEAMLYKLWDAGFVVGNVTRSLGECIDMAREDIVSRNALTTARRLWGSRDLFDTLGQKLDQDIFSARKKALLDELLNERAERYARFGEVACLQEPNVKESAGGLRDLHGLVYAAHIATGQKTIPEMVSGGLMSEQ